MATKNEMVPGLIVETRHTPRTINEIYDLFKKDKMRTPPYQRNPQVWKNKQQQEFLKSMFKGDIIPEVFAQIYGKNGKTKFNIIEGQQRIDTVCRFIDNEIELDKKYNPDYAEKTYKTLDEDSQQKFLDYEFDFLEMKTDDDDMMKDLYLRINTNQTNLNSPEKRHAKFYGREFNDVTEEYAKKYQEFYLKNGILKDGHIKRMYDNEITGEIFVLVLNGPQSSGQTLDRFYDLYSTFQEKNKAIKNVKRSISTIEKILPETLKGTNFDSLTNFYSLVGAINRTTEDCSILNEDLKKVNKELREFMRLVMIEKDGSKDENVRKYWESTQEGTRSKKNRTTRVDILTNILWNFTIPIDDKKQFSENQRKEIWNRSKSKKCMVCRRKVEKYDDYEADHVKPYSKGGKTIVGNGQVAHKWCNRTKSNKYNKK